MQIVGCFVLSMQKSSAVHSPHLPQLLLTHNKGFAMHVWLFTYLFKCTTCGRSSTVQFQTWWGESALWTEQQQSLVGESVGCSVATARGEWESKGVLQNTLIQELLRKAEPEAHSIMQIELIEPPKEPLKAWTAKGKERWWPSSSSEPPSCSSSRAGAGWALSLLLPSCTNPSSE